MGTVYGRLNDDSDCPSRQETSVYLDLASRYNLSTERDEEVSARNVTHD